MAEKIYKMFKGSMTEAWYALSKNEQDSLLEKLDASIKEVGAKRMLLCSSRWSTEKWGFFGVEEYPSIEAVQAHAEFSEKLNWFRYVNAEATLGTEFIAPE